MKEQLYELLREENKSIDWDKVDISFSKYFIDVAERRVDGLSEGRKFYTPYQAIEFLEGIGALL